MNDKTGGDRDPRRAAALAVVAAVAVLATGCMHVRAAISGSGGSATFAQELALAQCMRGHGEPNFPDPSPSGGFSLNITTLDSSQTQVAYGACRHLLPGGGPSLAQLRQQAQQRLQQQLPALLKFSQCMRTHGVPDFPDLTANGLPPASLQDAGISPTSPQFQAATRVCQSVLPAGTQITVGTHSSGARRGS